MPGNQRNLDDQKILNDCSFISHIIVSLKEYRVNCTLFLSKVASKPRSDKKFSANTQAGMSWVSSSWMWQCQNGVTRQLSMGFILYADGIEQGGYWPIPMSADTLLHHCVLINPTKWCPCFVLVCVKDVWGCDWISGVHNTVLALVKMFSCCESFQVRVVILKKQNPVRFFFWPQLTLLVQVLGGAKCY